MCGSGLGKASPPQEPTPETPPELLPSEFLAPYLVLSLKNKGVIRPHQEFAPKSTTTSQQVIELIDHLFVRYPVPLFLYRTMLSYDGLELIFDLPPHLRTRTKRHPADEQYRPWFRAVSRGDSFADLTRDTFTRREAHWFLQAPARFTIEENMHWARIAALEVPPDCSTFLLEQYKGWLMAGHWEKLRETFRFYGKHWDEIKDDDVQELTDYLRSTFYNADFSIKGRTLASVRRLCDKWHQLRFEYSPRLKAKWHTRFPVWSRTIDGFQVVAVELTDAKALFEEGDRQNHCVYSYVQRCFAGDTSIVSLRRSNFLGELSTCRLTLEISSGGAVVQIKGAGNRPPTEEEMEIVRLWTKDLGLKLRVGS